VSRPVRLEPTAVAPGAVEQMMAKLEEPSTIVGVKLDEPEAFEVVRVIAGRAKADGGGSMELPISPPNAFVIVLVKSKLAEGETRICAGDLLLAGDAPSAATKPAMPPPPQAVVPMPAAMPAAPLPLIPATGAGALKVDARGWPQGGLNEVWVLMNRGEAERLVLAINGYPITAAERPALLRRFGQALGTVK